MRENRYSRQILLPEIGPEGQRKLSMSRAVVIGCGALGTNALSFLVRAGVGQVVVADRDIVDLSNLQRQALFEEGDIGRPKAKVAEERLRKTNSEIDIKGIVSDLSHANIEGTLRGAHVVLDATDNMDTRFLVNDACVKHGIPWVYAGAVGVTGMVMPVVPGGPCLACVFPNLPQPGQLPTCDTVGIANTLPGAVASFEVTEAFKIMLGRAPIRDLMVLDIWQGEVQRIKVRRNPDCGLTLREECGSDQASQRAEVRPLGPQEELVEVRPSRDQGRRPEVRGKGRGPDGVPGRKDHRGWDDRSFEGENDLLKVHR